MFHEFICCNAVIGIDESFKICTYPGVCQNMYLIGYKGTIVNLIKDFIVTQRIGSGGYPQLHLMTPDKGSRDFMTHRLVAWEWVLENRDFSLEVNHKDGNKSNNHYTNLEWVNHLDNVRHAFDNGLVGSSKGINHSHILSEEDVRMICKELLDPNTTYKEVINNLGLNVAVPTIQAIANGLNWSHITHDYLIPPRNRSKPHKKFNDYPENKLAEPAIGVGPSGG